MQFLYNENREVVAEKDYSGNIIRYIRGLGQISSDSENAKTYYHYEYDVFGNTISCEERVANRFRYQGEQYDSITRQYYLRAHYYNPVIGRFIQEDTYYGDGLNLYEYCRNNTITYKDPTGHNICATQRNLYHKYSGVGNGNDPWRSYETSYGKSSLIELKNTDNFMDSTIEHIFEGNVRRGKAGGYHYECIKDTAGNIVNGTEVLINDLGVYKAQVEVNGIPKSGNGGYSTFFPKERSPQDVIDSINEAYNNKVFVVGSKNSYIGISNNGLEIEMYINNNGKIISAFPKE